MISYKQHLPLCQSFSWKTCSIFFLTIYDQRVVGFLETIHSLSRCTDDLPRVPQTVSGCARMRSWLQSLPVLAFWPVLLLPHLTLSFPGSELRAKSCAQHSSDLTSLSFHCLPNFYDSLTNALRLLLCQSSLRVSGLTVFQYCV